MICSLKGRKGRNREAVARRKKKINRGRYYKSHRKEKTQHVEEVSLQDGEFNRRKNRKRKSVLGD